LYDVFLGNWVYSATWSIVISGSGFGARWACSATSAPVLCGRWRQCFRGDDRFPVFDLRGDRPQEPPCEVWYVGVVGSASLPCDRGGCSAGAGGGDRGGCVGVDVVFDAARDLEKVA
jgi:hypothetical protein